MDNTNKWTEEDLKINESATALGQKFGNEFGLHVQLYVGLTGKVMKHLLKIISSLDHLDFECFVLVVLSKGRKEALYDVRQSVIPIPTLLEFFSDEKCETLRGKPKLFLFNTIVDTSQAQPFCNREEELRQSLPNDSLLIFSTDTEAGSQSSLQSLLDNTEIDDMASINNIKAGVVNDEHTSSLVIASFKKRFNIYKIRSHCGLTE